MSTTSNKRQLTSGISVFAVAVSLCVAQPAYAQAQYGSIEGHVAGAKAGTKVEAVDTATGQRSVGTVNANGDYVILGLRPSTYTVTTGGGSAQTATINVGQAVTIDFGATTAGTGTNIVVTGRRAAPAQAQTVSTNITTAQIENLPQNQRNFLSFAALAPGVALISPSGAAQLQAGALAPQNANILLDGMSFKNPINHGGMLGQNFGDFGNPFPQIAIQEYQLQTQNFGAENGQSASALLSAVTKTGGNKFHGSGFIEWQPKAFIEKPHFQTGPKQDYDRKQFGGDIGGPIIPGKLSFYAAFEGTNQKRPAATFNNLTTTIPQNIRAEIDSSIPLDFKQRLYFGKLTWFASPDDTVNLSGYKRKQSNLADFGGNAVESHGHLLETNQDRYQLQWRHSAGEFLNFLNIAYDKATQGTPNVTEGPEYILKSAIDTGSQDLVLMGANSFQQNDVVKNWTIRDDATLRHGAHTFKAGGQITFYKLSRIEAANTNGTYFVVNPCASPTATCPPTFDIATAAPFAGRININPAPGLTAKDTQLGLYITDEWKPDDHWTVNAGIRWDFESNPNNKDYVTPAAIATALRAYPGWAARGINPEDYISNGHNRNPFYGAFQPRLGVAYDVHGDRDMVVFGGAGRYYDRNLFIQGVIEQQQNANTIITVGTSATDPFRIACASATPPAYCHDPEALRAYVTSLGFTGGAVWVLPNKVKMPYSDQFDLGVRKRFGDITATLTYSHVESHHISMFARANFYNNGWFTVARTATGCVNGGDQWIIDFTPNGPFPNCSATNGQLTGFNGKLNRGLSNGRARLDAIFLQIEKPFTDSSEWGFTEAITLQRAKSNVAQELNSDEFFNGPTLDTYGWNRVNGVEKWRTVTSANWRAPYGFTLSGTLTLSSGPAFGHIVAPWNGLTGTVPEGACCFANMGGVFFPNKDIAYKRLDVRIAKTFKMPWGHEATIDFEAFNVFNWLNRTYSSWGAGGGEPPPLTENGQVANDQRQFQVGLKYKF